MGFCIAQKQKGVADAMIEAEMGIWKIWHPKYTYCMSRRNFFGDKQLWVR